MIEANPTEPSPPRHTLALARLASWAHIDMGYPLEEDVIFDPEIISDFVTEHHDIFTPAQIRRTFTLCMCTATHLDLGPDASAFSTPTPALPPILSDEQSDALVDAARDDIDALRYLALTLGAGLTNAEAASVQWSDITVDEIGVIVRVNGRQVPVLEALSQSLVAPNAHGFVYHPHVTKYRQGIMTRTIRRWRDSGLLEGSSSSLRATWIVGHMTAGIPDQVIAQIAGTGNVGKYTELRRAPDMSTYRDLMHNVTLI